MLLITGVKWVALSQIARALSQLVLIFVLARYLTPYDYGLISIVSVVAAFAMLFRDMGTSSILIQRRRISENFIKSTYTLNFISGLVIFIVMTLLAYPISLFYNDTRLFLLILIISFSFPLQSFIAFNFALLER
ncbi:O185 family O-antigen flippase, partial [Escherichia coli]|nr:O185 family O-antigen flippase [Escherichia coli]